MKKKGNTSTNKVVVVTVVYHNNPSISVKTRENAFTHSRLGNHQLILYGMRTKTAKSTEKRM